MNKARGQCAACCFVLKRQRHQFPWRPETWRRGGRFLDSRSSDSVRRVCTESRSEAATGSLMALCVVQEEVEYRRLLFLLISDAPIWGGGMNTDDDHEKQTLCSRPSLAGHTPSAPPSAPPISPPAHPQLHRPEQQDSKCQTEGRWNHGGLEFHLTLHTLPEAVHTARRTLHQRSSPPLTTNFTLDQICTLPDLCHCTDYFECSDGSCGPKDGLCHEAS